MTVDLVFVEHNGTPVSTPTIAASPGDTLDMAILLRNDIALTGFGVSLDFDVGGSDELDVVSAVQWTGVVVGKVGVLPAIPLDPPSDPGSLGTGRIQSFHVLAPSKITGVSLPAGVTYQIGTVSWTVTENVATSGADVVSGLLKVGFDGVLGPAFEAVDSLVLFNSATVNAVAAVPSISRPGAAAAVGLILVAAFWARTRSRR